jgi:hypothetical protein
VESIHHALLSRLTAAVDPRAATPVYHQIAQVVAREVRAGRLPIGVELPAVRLVAGRVGVNYHTVRRAYQELAETGAVRLRRGLPARIDRVPPDDTWTPAGTAIAGLREIPRVWLVEDSLTQAARLALAISSRWTLEAVPWPASASAPPPGLILATTDRPLERSPDRESDLRVVPLALNPGTTSQVLRVARRLGLSGVTIVSQSQSAPIAELRRQLPRLGLVTGGTEQVPDQSDGSGLLLVEPALWDRLDWARRTDPLLMPIEYTWAAGPLARVAREWGWLPRQVPAEPAAGLPK